MSYQFVVRMHRATSLPHNPPLYLLRYDWSEAGLVEVYKSIQGLIMISALLLLCLFEATTSMQGHLEDDTTVGSGFCLSSNKVSFSFSLLFVLLA